MEAFPSRAASPIVSHRERPVFTLRCSFGATPSKHNSLPQLARASRDAVTGSPGGLTARAPGVRGFTSRVSTLLFASVLPAPERRSLYGPQTRKETGVSYSQTGVSYSRSGSLLSAFPENWLAPSGLLAVLFGPVRRQEARAKASAGGKEG